MEFDIPMQEPSIIKVVGVGGGGCNAVSHMYKQGIVGVDFAICNTDSQSMEQSPVPIKIQLGPALTEGRGAGSLPQVGKQACIESIEEVRKFIEGGTKMLFITAGMGGGTGTGAAPIIAKASRELGILTVAIVTVPFQFEGRRRKDQAEFGLEELKKNVDSLIIVSNDKLREIYGNLPVSEAFANADNILTTASKGIAEIITVAGYINVDFEDVNTVMRESGVSIMGTASAEGEDRARKAVDVALNSPLLEDNDIRGARHILLNITSGSKEVTMDEVYEITEFVQGEAGEDTDLIWGNCYDETLGDRIAVTVIATGFEEINPRKRVVEDAPKEETIKVPLEDNFYQTEGLFAVGAPSAEKNVFDLSLDDQMDTRSAVPQTDPYIRKVEEVPAEMQKSTEDDRVKKEELRRQKQKLSNPQTVIDMENEPAYLRRKVMLDDVPHSSEIVASRWSITGEDEPKLRENPYLHDNVD